MNEGYWFIEGVWPEQPRRIGYVHHLIHPRVAEQAGWETILPVIIRKMQHEAELIGADVSQIRWRGAWAPTLPPKGEA